MFFFSLGRRLVDSSPTLKWGVRGWALLGEWSIHWNTIPDIFSRVWTPTTGQNKKIIRQVSTISGWGVAGFVSCEGGEEREGWGRGIGGWAFGGVGNGGIWKTHSFVRLGGATAYRIC